MSWRYCGLHCIHDSFPTLDIVAWKAQTVSNLSFVHYLLVQICFLHRELSVKRGILLLYHQSFRPRCLGCFLDPAFVFDHTSLPWTLKSTTCLVAAYLSLGLFVGFTGPNDAVCVLAMSYMDSGVPQGLLLSKPLFTICCLLETS